MYSKKNVGKPRLEEYVSPVVNLFALSTPQDILIQMSIELDAADFEEGEDL